MSGSGSASGDLARIGRRAFSEGLVSGNFGNASLRAGDVFLVMQSGAYLDDPGLLVPVPFEGDVPPGASLESLVHRAVYNLTPHNAILHTHPPFAVILSFDREEIVPADIEGALLCPRIPVVTGDPGSLPLGDRVAHALMHGKIVIARGHGTFAAGKTLEEAYLVTSAAEHTCRILVYRELLGRQAGR
ncbi:MAG TPA: class II aldolase/adducin family protein [Methanomicrobiales archaeon]|jgi:L-fuculose-phosphate aldolase|nr:class II aldolase/adducin family protein [Methanomicrobiales archaeon]